MTEQQRKYFKHEVNAMPCDGMTMNREFVNGVEHVYIEFKDKILYEFWNNPNKKAPKNTLKHTGGKPSYVKLLLKEMQKHKDMSLECAGLIQKIIPNIQWKTNLIINTRSKTPLITDDISKIIMKSKPVTLRLIKELMQLGLLIKDKDGYKISTTLIQKGGGGK